MSTFSARRFGRVMRNDLWRVARPALYCMAALLGTTVAIYLIAFRNARPTSDPVHEVLFGCCLIITGLLFTGAAFRDMHHPLQRYQYLMLPVSNLERLLSRYLLTGPLFVLCATSAFMAFDFIGNQLTHIWINERQLRFSPFAGETLAVIWGYLMAHLAVFTGAICFRSHALLKTLLFLLVAVFGLALFEELALRIFHPDSYSWTQFSPVHPVPVELMPWFTASWMNYVACIAIAAWVLYVAYFCLRDHEAADGV
jgi:hypothetical protein